MKVAIFGLGIIGGTWAQHYETDGVLAASWNRSPKSAPRFTPDIRAAAASADVLHIVVSDPPAVDDLLRQILPELHPEKFVIQSSTISPAWAEKNEALVKATGAIYVEAPFTGSKPAAEARKLVFFLGGSPENRTQARKILEKIGRKFFELESVAHACAIKLAMNLNIAGVAQTLFESISFARKYHINDEFYFSVLDENVSHSGVSDLKKEKLLNNDFSPQFSVKHMWKDLRLTLESAGELKTPLTSQVEQIYATGAKNNLADADFSSLITLLSSQINP